MNRTIQFCYRKIIDASALKAWERLVFEDSYTEFKMQAQRFNKNGAYNSFGQILQHDAAAEQLHFLVSGSIIAYVKYLEEKIPDVVNTLGKQFLPFKNFRFEIINSDITDASKHTVAINFISEPVTWLDSIGDKMIINLHNKKENEEWLTETISLQPFLSIYSVKQ